VSHRATVLVSSWGWPTRPTLTITLSVTQFELGAAGLGMS
jgi:hypothetical protein